MGFAAERPTQRNDPIDDRGGEVGVYALGHVGIVLLAFAPIAFHLHRTNRTPLAVGGTAQAVVLSTSPDVDRFLAGVAHRGVTHTVWFAFALGSVLATLAAMRARDRTGATGQPRWATPVSSALVGTYAVVAHLAGDVITPMGIAPLAPVVDAHYTLAVVAAADPTTNRALFALGCLATAGTWLAGTDRSPQWIQTTTAVDRTTRRATTDPSTDDGVEDGISR